MTQNQRRRARDLYTAAEEDPAAVLESVETLGELLATTDQWTRANAALAVAEVAGEYPEHVEPLLSDVAALLDDDAEAPRQNGARALAAASEEQPRAVAPYVETLCGVLDDEDARVDATYALSNVSRVAPDALSPYVYGLCGVLDDGDARVNVTHALSNVAENSHSRVEPHVDTLAWYVDDEDERTRANVTYALSAVARKSPDAVEPHVDALEPLLTADDATTRTNVSLALEHVADAFPDSVDKSPAELRSYRDERAGQQLSGRLRAAFRRLRTGLARWGRQLHSAVPSVADVRPDGLGRLSLGALRGDTDTDAAAGPDADDDGDGEVDPRQLIEAVRDGMTDDVEQVVSEDMLSEAERACEEGNDRRVRSLTAEAARAQEVEKVLTRLATVDDRLPELAKDEALPDAAGVRRRMRSNLSSYQTAAAADEAALALRRTADGIRALLERFRADVEAVESSLEPSPFERSAFDGAVDRSDARTFERAAVDANEAVESGSDAAESGAVAASADDLARASEHAATARRVRTEIREGFDERMTRVARRKVSAVREQFPVEDIGGDVLAEATSALDRDDPARALSLAERAEVLLTVDADLERASDLAATAEDVPVGVDTDPVDERVRAARRALDEGDRERARERATAAVDRAEASLETAAERAIERLAPLASLDDPGALSEAVKHFDAARGALAEQRNRGAVEAAERAESEAATALPAFARETTGRVDAAAGAFDDGDYVTARDHFGAARDRLDAAVEVGDVVYNESPDDVDVPIATLRQRIDAFQEDVRAAAERRVSEGLERRRRGDAAEDEGKYVDAASAYAAARERFETVAAMASQFDVVPDDVDRHERRAERAAAEAASAAESAVDVAYEVLPEAVLDRPEDLRERLHGAADAIADGDHEEAAATAIETLHEAVGTLEETAEDHRAAAREAFRDGDYPGAVDRWQRARETCERRRDVAAAADDGAAVADAEAALDRIDARVDEARTQAEERALDLAAAARDEVDEGERLFMEDRYEEAEEAYRSAREQYSNALELAWEFDLEQVASLEEERERIDERIPYCRLAEGARRIEAARDLVQDDPGAARERVDVARNYLSTLSFDRDEHQRDLGELLSELTRVDFEARVEIGRDQMRAAERLYDDERLHDARERYDAAKRHLGTLAADTEGDNVDPPPTLEPLVEACEENGRRIEEALSGVARMRRDDDGIERVADVSGDDDSRDDVAERTGVAGAGEGLPAGAGEGVGEGSPVPEFEDRERLGSGGNATVWRVTRGDGTDAALKIPYHETTLARSDVDRFLEQAQTWSRIDDHPNVVTVYGWGFDARPWLLMEYVEGGSLDERVGSMTVEDALDVLVGVAKALVHARGIDHLDVKPANVLLSRDGTPKLADWGLASVAFEHAETETRLGVSPPFAAPEQIDETLGPRDDRTDIYQLGATGYVLLTGQLPFDPQSPESLEQRILAEQPPAPSDVSDVPSAVDDVLLTAMAKDRDERYEATIKIRDALQGVRQTIREGR